MAYDPSLAERIHSLLGDISGLEEKKMFGGVGFMLSGNMACGVIGDDLILRVEPKETEDYLAKPFCKPFDTYGRKMNGWILVSPQGFKSDEDLRKWVQQGVDYVGTLPEK